MQTLLKNTQAYSLLKRERQERGFSHAYLLLLKDKKNLRLALKTFAKVFFDCDSPIDAASKRRAELIDGENFSDCLFYPQEGKKLTVDDAARIQEESTLNAVECEKKLFVLGDFAEANIQTQNKLLKLLEEPPENVYFLLGASVVYPILITVLSRTKKLEIQPFTPEQITGVLLRKYGEEQKEAFSLCAVAGNGSVGDAEDMLSGGFYQELLSSAFELALATPVQLPALVKKVGETKRARELLSLLRLIYRDALVLKMQKSGNLLLKTEKQGLISVCEKYTPHALLFAQEAISRAEKQLNFNAVFPYCIELCMANILEENK